MGAVGVGAVVVGVGAVAVGVVADAMPAHPVITTSG